MNKPTTEVPPELSDELRAAIEKLGSWQARGITEFEAYMDLRLALRNHSNAREAAGRAAGAAEERQRLVAIMKWRTTDAVYCQIMSAITSADYAPIAAAEGTEGES